MVNRLRSLRWIACGLAALVAFGSGVRAQDTASEKAARVRYDGAMKFLQERKYTEGVRDLKEIVQIYKESRVASSALLQLALYYLDVAGDPAAALTHVDPLLKDYDQSDAAPLARVLHGRITIAMSRSPASIESALADYGRVQNWYPHSDGVPIAQYYAGETLRVIHREDEAARFYRDASSGYPQSIWAARALLGEAQCLVRAGDIPHAMEALQQVRVRFATRPEAATAAAWNTILYRLYVRAGAHPPFEFRGKTVAGPGGKLNDVLALALPPDGSVIAATRNVVVRLDPSGRPQPVPGGAEPSAIAFDPSGNLLVASRGGVTLPGGKLLALGLPKPDGQRRELETIPGLAVSSVGVLLAIDRNAKTVARFSGDGRYLSSMNTGGADRLIIDNTDTMALLLSDEPSMLLVDQEGKVVARIPKTGKRYQFDNPVDIAFDPFGHLYVLDRGLGAVMVFKADGAFVASFSIPQKTPGVFRRATALALDSAGRLYIADGSAEKVQVYQ
jgi:TolA-binding protein